MICPLCGKKHTDDTKKEATELPNVCAECNKATHKAIKVQCILECGPNGITKHEGVYILDQLTKLFLGRGITPLSIEFLEQYAWLDIPKEDVKKLQEQGVLQK
jgi:hypothetical protein